MIRIGLISDTHGLVRPEALDFLRGCDRIVHAGDICEPGVLAQLAGIAPVTAVQGNNDIGAWADRLGPTALLSLGASRLLVIHDLKQLRPASLAPEVRVVVHGHSHRPGVEERDGVLYVNPGSAGPRRFSLPISIGELRVEGDALSARTVGLVPASP